jgi:hypothetical protein
MTESQIAVLPCPFCGSTFTGKGGNYWECHDCFASGPTVDWDETLQGDEFDKAAMMQWNARNPLKSLEHFIDRQIECMDESGQWMTHAIDALLVLQSRIDERLKRMGCPGQ